MAIGVWKAKLPVKIVLAFLTVCLLLVPFTFAADEKDSKVQTLRQAAKQLLDVGYEQYQRGLYDNARETLNKAASYKQYLSGTDAELLDELLKKLGERYSTEANQPVSEPNTVAAQDNNEIVFLPLEANDINQTQQTMPAIPVQVNPQFITPVSPEVNTGAILEANQPVQVKPAQKQVVSTDTTKEDYIEVVKQKQRIQQSYTKAVVNDAVAKAKEFADKQDFAKARDEITRAQAVVEKNKMLLGDADYTQYKDALNQLWQQIDTRQSEAERLKAEQTRAEAKAAQEKLRQQQLADKQQRIKDLLESAMEFQEQQRYEEALAQLDTLLAIDPLNRQAIRNKQMLEDIISLRKQLEVKKEMGKEEQATLTDLQRSMIPHADLITYPRNWQDIAKREPKTITGLSPADAAVYKQLETVVDLSALTPDTPFEEAIETVRTSIDPPLKIIVRWKDLEENAYVERDTPIGMQGISGITLGKGLKELLDAVSGGVTKIDFAVEDGVITVATATSLPAKLVTHVYDVTELVGVPADFTTELQSTEVTGGGGELEETADIIQERAENLMQIIQNTISPMSWLENGGEGTIVINMDTTTAKGAVRLIISQTPQVHEQIKKLLMEDMLESFGEQISIETRFLFVTENFLEDIGLGISNLYIKGSKISSNLGDMIFSFGSYEGALPPATLVPGTIASDLEPPIGSGTIPHAIDLTSGGSYGIPVLDDLALSFFLRATQVHRDAKMLTAPRVTVLSGEQAYIRLAKEQAYVSDYEFEDITTAGEGQPVRVVADPTVEEETGGIVLVVTPTITSDKKYVVLRISTNYTRLNFADFTVSDTTGAKYPIQLPVSEVSEVQTRVTVPDRGTLLIGGQKLGAEANRESGVPGLSKVPLLGRLFSHRSKVKDQDVLLILVKPTIILREETEKQYFAPLK